MQQLQDTLCDAFEKVDGTARFREDPWQRPGGGGGRTRVLAEGTVFEKAGVNWSEVHGEMNEALAGEVPGEGRDFHATGVSMVLHTRNPMVPAFHANIRMISKGDARWVGGGADMTPYYPREEDAVHFHSTWKKVCEPFDSAWHPRFKSWCDEYFYLPHRNEMRGIGGIFFDYVGLSSDVLPARAIKNSPRALEEAVPIQTAWEFIQSVGNHLLTSYVPVIERRMGESWTEEERQFQLVRRGRYAEFNLLYDRGTQFGLRTNGRTESILMSMPPLARWDYDAVPPAGSREAILLDFLKPRDWVS